MKVSTRRWFAAALVASVAGGANAATYTFGTLLSGPGAPASPSFATLNANVVGADVQFTLNAFGLDLFTGSTPFIGSMAVDGTQTGSVSNVSGGGVTSVAIANGSAPGGYWDFRFGFGGGSDKLIDNETVSWTWVGGAGNYTNFATHVQGIAYGSSGSTESAWYTPAIPEPSGYQLGLAGLAVAAFVAIRRRPD